MTEQRKHMRVALSAAEYVKFSAAKAKAEAAAQQVMTDPQYAVSLIRWAVRDAGN
jgi:hypothetical protein